MNKILVTFIRCNNYSYVFMLTKTDTQFVTDKKGKKIAVILPIDQYQKMKEDQEMLEDIGAYDKAKEEDDGERISLEQVLKECDLSTDDLNQ